MYNFLLGMLAVFGLIADNVLLVGVLDEILSTGFTDFLCIGGRRSVPSRFYQLSSHRDRLLFPKD